MSCFGYGSYSFVAAMVVVAADAVAVVVVVCGYLRKYADVDVVNIVDVVLLGFLSLIAFL